MLPFCHLAGNQYVPLLLTFVAIRCKGDCLRFVPQFCNKKWGLRCILNVCCGCYNTAAYKQQDDKAARVALWLKLLVLGECGTFIFYFNAKTHICRAIRTVCRRMSQPIVYSYIFVGRFYCSHFDLCAYRALNNILQLLLISLQHSLPFSLLIFAFNIYCSRFSHPLIDWINNPQSLTVNRILFAPKSVAISCVDKS